MSISPQVILHEESKWQNDWNLIELKFTFVTDT